ncbi:MAG: 1-acyl-sn-glycerol-3-phosphate acyltransferase [Candidatus Thermoplasmatota archaeon]|nr:1-acyl-sn-glycerol-3-phosphate acyltransferase [Candidatus Thermoplasmatota archaeon]
MQAGEDGAVDEKGELLPVLSKSATRMKYDKLIKAPLPQFSGEMPGSYFWTNFAYFLLRKVLIGQFKSFECSGTENIPSDRGSLCAAWHTNGLLDPISIMVNHPKKFVIGGRHDLATRPLLGFWARKLAMQPVVRKAELLRGGCTEEQASALNGRTLLNLATGVSHGFGCVLFPEGTSHSESHLIRLRTGPSRTVLAAAALAKHQQKPLPVIIPVGLHFRTRHFFRTDAWIEFSEPISLEEISLPEDLMEAVASTTWAEPPAELVIELRDKIGQRLQPLTPNTQTWDEYRMFQLLGQVKGRLNSEPPKSWKEEIVLTREMQQLDHDEEILQSSKTLSKSMFEANLDGRDLNSSGDKLRGFSTKRAAKNISLSILSLFFLPIFVWCFGIQITLGRILGDRTDEGLDARTSYQFLAALFGSMIIWPIQSVLLILCLIFFDEQISTQIGLASLNFLGDSTLEWIFYALFLIPITFFLFYISSRTTLWIWDSFVDFRQFLRRRRASSLNEKITILSNLMQKSGRYL